MILNFQPFGSCWVYSHRHSWSSEFLTVRTLATVLQFVELPVELYRPSASPLNSRWYQRWCNWTLQAINERWLFWMASTIFNEPWSLDWRMFNVSSQMVRASRLSKGYRTTSFAIWSYKVATLSLSLSLEVLRILQIPDHALKRIPRKFQISASFLVDN